MARVEMGAAAKKALEQQRIIAAELASIRDRLAEARLRDRRPSQREQQLREQLEDRRQLLERALDDMRAIASNAD
jgi:hypothetical protein